MTPLGAPGLITMRTTGRFAAGLLLSVLVVTSTAMGHPHPVAPKCAHTHVAGTIVACMTVGAACTPPTGSTCQHRGGRVVQRCVCVPPPRKKCWALLFYVFQPDVKGFPQANTVRRYTAVGDERNVLEILLGETLLATFDAEFDPLEGTSVTLAYGSFDDPENVPVEVQSFAAFAPKQDPGIRRTSQVT